jgi:hypothetical protein
MSKNVDRYKNRLEELDEDTLLELDTEAFEKFASKKSKDNSKKSVQKKVDADD